MMSDNTTKEITRSDHNVEVKTGSTDEQNGCEWTYRPNVDIIEFDNTYQIIADIPGAEKEAINLSFEDDMLTIDAVVRPRISEGFEYTLREFGIGNFHRRFKISEDVEVNDIQADYNNGVLTIALPKKQAAQRRQIEINAE